MWCPEQIAGVDPIKWNLPRPNLVEEVRQTLDAARDEGPLQRFFEANPVALLTGLVRPNTG